MSGLGAIEQESLSRRSLFRTVGSAMYVAALTRLLGQDLYGAEASRRQIRDLQPRTPDSEPTARGVIHLFMNGGPSQMDLFDPKPDLIRLAGQPLPESFGAVMTRRKVAENPLLKPLMSFVRRGDRKSVV